MSLSEEELQEYEFYMAQNGWLIADYAAELIQEVRELQLDVIGNDDDRDGMICQLEERAEAAERREKVAMRALENIAKRAWSTPDDTVRWYLEQAEKEFSNER